MDVLDLGQNLTPVSRDSSTISNQVKCSLVGWPILGCNKVPNRTDAAAASEKPRGDVRNWAHCADEDEAISGPNHQPNSIVTADRLRCGARVCRRDAELFCNTSAVRQHYSKSGVGHVRSSKQGCAGLGRPELVISISAHLQGAAVFCCMRERVRGVPLREVVK